MYGASLGIFGNIADKALAVLVGIFVAYIVIEKAVAALVFETPPAVADAVLLVKMTDRSALSFGGAFRFVVRKLLSAH